MLVGMLLGGLLGACLGYIIAEVALGDGTLFGAEIARLSAMSGAIVLGQTSGIVCGIVGGVTSVVRNESTHSR